MHPRVSLQQIPFLDRPVGDFLAFCADSGFANAVLATALLEGEALATVQGVTQSRGLRIAALTQVFCRDLSQAGDEATSTLRAGIATAQAVGAPAIYMITGGRGAYGWEEAAERFATLLEPCRQPARDAGVKLLIENILPLYADMHIAHGLEDTITLATNAGAGLCIELFHCWTEPGIEARLRRAAPLAGLVQVSDYVLGDRTLPARAVPGDGAIPIEAMIAALLEGGYNGVFDLELVGPRIAAEGTETAAVRAGEYVSELLARLGA
ncbi:MAG: sugar phosphate isomerase/epimerase [Novosphingobium sp.]